MQIERLEISERFCGPPRSGNGGYVCGRIAKHIPGTATVRLRAPPPLNTELRLEFTDEEARLFQDAQLLGEAKRTALVDLQSYQFQKAWPSSSGNLAHPLRGGLPTPSDVS